MTPQFRSCLVLLVIAITILSTPSLDRSAIEAQAPRPAASKNGARAELDQGRALLRRSQADQALGHLDSALQLYQQAGNPEGKAAANDALGDLYATQGQYQAALGYYQEAQKSFRDGNKPSNASIETAKIADVHMRMGNADAARQAFAEIDSRRQNSRGVAGGAAASGAGSGSTSSSCLRYWRVLVGIGRSRSRWRIRSLGRRRRWSSRNRQCRRHCGWSTCLRRVEPAATGFSGCRSKDA